MDLPSLSKMKANLQEAREELHRDENHGVLRNLEAANLKVMALHSEMLHGVAHFKGFHISHSDVLLICDYLHETNIEISEAMSQLGMARHVQEHKSLLYSRDMAERPDEEDGE